MVKTLVLVRHGNPEPTSESGADIDRRLTPAGLHALEAAYPATFALLGSCSSVAVWSSPADRARQTASVVRDALVLDDPEAPLAIEEHDCLYEQDLRAFVAELEAADAQTVIAVGHIPFMDVAAAHYLGSCPAFGKGAAAAIELPEGPDGLGRLRWFVAAPKAVAWQELGTVERQVAAAARDLAARAEDFLATPESPDALREFRVALRRVRSLLQFVEPWQAKKDNRRAQHQIRELQEATSRLRGLDILAVSVAGLVESGELGDNSLLPVACANERSLECFSVVSHLRKEHVVRELRALARSLAGLRWRGEVLERGLTVPELQAHFDQELDELDAEVFGLDLRDGDAVYVARRDAKEMHYVAEQLGEVLGPERAVMAEHMGELQAELGALSDARRNRRLAEECAKSPRFRGVRADLGVVARDQAEVVSAIASGLESQEEGLDEADDEAAAEARRAKKEAKRAKKAAKKAKKKRPLSGAVHVGGEATRLAEDGAEVEPAGSPAFDEDLDDLVDVMPAFAGRAEDEGEDWAPSEEDEGTEEAAAWGDVGGLDDLGDGPEDAFEDDPDDADGWDAAYAVADPEAPLAAGLADDPEVPLADAADPEEA